MTESLALYPNDWRYTALTFHIEVISSQVNSFASRTIRIMYYITYVLSDPPTDAISSMLHVAAICVVSRHSCEPGSVLADLLSVAVRMLERSPSMGHTELLHFFRSHGQAWGKTPASSIEQGIGTLLILITMYKNTNLSIQNFHSFNINQNWKYYPMRYSSIDDNT